MFLRSLYGSRMPQALHPRVDPQASSYWQEDTVSSQEIARAMDEEVDAFDEGGKKTNGVLAPAVALVGDEQDSRRCAFRGLLSPLTALLGTDGMALDDVAGLGVADMSSSPVNARLSPAGLISIAAADIDEAATNSSQNVPPVNGGLDLAFIRSLRQSSGEAETGVSSCSVLHVANTALTHLLGSVPPTRRMLAQESGENAEAAESENKLFSLIRRHFDMLKASSSLLARAYEKSHDANEGQGKLRFLSLLRRINELRSQQVDTESWDGLPYPQIITLPTFKYRLREQLADGNQSGVDSEVSNTVCAVCCDGFKAGEEVRALPCLHFYHRECIDQWLMCHRQCPICKHVVSVY
ncbi:unnamed protein product [Hyaloperonospora brassicae]|uniref:RING-type domain-containing protein n=1 Tax=Hyaloperonospora brassicae TaxID=162125 RepID=A0AAV0V3L8_HYABA|nr:unnamed protein product [Hyaloperonospora brassicae]